MQDWLSGKTGGAVDHYAEEQRKRKEPTLVKGHIIASFLRQLCEGRDPTQDDSTPYNRSYKEPVDLELLYECLRQMLERNEPLPMHLTERLMDDVLLLLSRREGDLLRWEKKKKKGHPSEQEFHDMVVFYVKLAKVWANDDNPLKTIEDELGIPRSTYYSWLDKSIYKIIGPVVDGPGMEQHIQEVWEILVDHYSP